MTSSPRRSSGVARPRLTGHNNPDRRNRLTVPFDIDQFISSCTAGRLDMYFDAIQCADDAALERFRTEVIRHKRQPQKTRYAAEHTPQGIYRFSPHDEYLLKAIWWERTKRSRFRMWIYKNILPIRRAWLFFWRGMELKDNKYFGYITIARTRNYGIIPYIGVRMTIFQATCKVRRYIIRHHWRIISALIAIAAIYVTWLSK
jgi:hypothetical protein